MTATNRHTGFAVDIETGEPRLAGPAGIGGTWVKPLSLRWVHRIYRELGIPISGSNGIFDHRDVVEFIMTGASIVQVGSILMAKGIKWLPKIIDGFEKFMDAHDYASVEEMIGIASRRSVKDYAEQFSKQRKYAEIVHDTCKNPTCNVCIQVCFYEALSQNRAGRSTSTPTAASVASSATISVRSTRSTSRRRRRRSSHPAATFHSRGRVRAGQVREGIPSRPEALPPRAVNVRVIPALVAGIHHSSCSVASRSLDAGDKPRYDHGMQASASPTRRSTSRSSWRSRCRRRRRRGRAAGWA